MKYLRQEKNGVVIQIQVLPNAKENKVVEVEGERCKIKIKAPPVDNKANVELVEFLAKMFGLAKKNVNILQGEHSKYKAVLLQSINIEVVANKLRGIK